MKLISLTFCCIIIAQVQGNMPNFMGMLQMLLVPRSRVSPGQLFEMGDVNGDECLTWEELKLIMKIGDINGNGVLTRGEFTMLWTAGKLGSLQESRIIFDNIDSDQDHNQSTAEAFSLYNFLDVNRNRCVTEAEFTTQWPKLESVYK